MKCFAVLAAFVILSPLLSPVSAAMPKHLSYQAKLTDGDGKALTGTYDFNFKIYDDRSDTGVTHLKWSENQPSVTVNNGLYAVELGSGTLTGGADITTLPFDVPYFLEIEVRVSGSGGVFDRLTPRIPLLAAPYAFLSAAAASVNGNLSITNFNGGSGASNLTFWRGDGTWASPGGGGDMQKAVEGVAIGQSTGTLRIELNAVAVSTGTLMPWTNQVSLSTGVTGNLSPSRIAAGNLGATVITSSVAVNSVGIPQINASGVPSATTYLRGDGQWSAAAAGDMTKAVEGVAIGQSTGTLRSELNAVAVSTGTLMPWTNQVSLSTGVTGNLSPSRIAAGNLGATVITSSVAINSVGIPQINASGSAGASTYLCGDGQWLSVGPGGIDVTNSPTNGQYLQYTTSSGGKFRWQTPSGTGDMLRASDGVSIGQSTATLRNDLTAVAISTGTLMPWSNQVSLSTGVTGNLSSTRIAAGFLDTSVIASSVAINSVGIPQINASGVPSVTTYLRGDGQWSSAAGDMTKAVEGVAIGQSTGTLRTDIDTVALSTGTLMPWVNQVSLSTGVTGNLDPSRIAAGSLGSSVLISSITPGNYFNDVRVSSAICAEYLVDGKDAYSLGQSTMSLFSLSVLSQSAYSIDASSSIRVGNGSTFSVEGDSMVVTGTVSVDFRSNVNCVKIFQNGADLAEVYSSTEKLETGDVVVISQVKNIAIERSKTPYDTKVMGVVSTEPGSILGSLGTGYPVALAGRVPVKVTDENGPIKRGDMLTTSSKPGYAMKATENRMGTIIGKALEPLDSGSGKITALITLK